MQNQNTKTFRNIAIFAGIAVAVFAIVFGAISLTKSGGITTEEDAMKQLDKVYNRISVHEITPEMGSVDLSPSDVKESLPDISKYPAQVENTTDTYIEIFSSPEKAGDGVDGWLVEVADKFNAAGMQVDGKTVSVRIRGFSSGVGMDYISSEKYVPDAFSPSNELWGDMLSAKGTKVTLAEEKLTGNVPGMLFSKDTMNELNQKYGSVNLENVIAAVKNGEISMGYTNPFASSTGLNFLVSTLCTFDSNDPLSTAAVSEFEAFQSHIPFVSYTTLQMRESAKSGALDGFILEYQSYENEPELKASYEFVPFGVRHDSPIYEIGELPSDKKEILQMFIDYCKNDENQTLASNYGFNRLDDYQYSMDMVDGGTVISAQKVWKENKNAGQDIVAVFVADISGSMQGEPMSKLKESLLNGAKSISDETSIGLVTFSDDVNVNLPIGKFDINQRSLFTGAVNNLIPNGGTAMYDGISVATKMLMEEKEKNPNAKLMLFVLTDGETNTGHRLGDVDDMLKVLRIPVYTIGYNANIDVLETLSSINEAASINADTDDVVYALENLFNAEM